MESKRLLSGMQPTGKLHIGNLEGALRNWVRLQDEYEMYCFIADWHALTTAYENPAEAEALATDVAIDFIAAGLDPERCAIFRQSHVKEHAELHLLLSMITPVPWLERVPTYKEKKENLQMDSASYGFLGYPVLQAADILMYKAHLVPVGKDQAAHLEITREIARRFNFLYCPEDAPLLPEPQELISETTGAVPGIDGRKMSKSYGNAIYIADSAEETEKKVKSMFTDPTKIKRDDPGHPETCPVFALHKIYNPEETALIEADCRAGTLGCVANKKRLAEKMNEALAPIRARRAELEANPKLVRDILAAGAEKARMTARRTMEEVHAAMGFCVGE